MNGPVFAWRLSNSALDHADQAVHIEKPAYTANACA